MGRNRLCNSRSEKGAVFWTACRIVRNQGFLYEKFRGSENDRAGHHGSVRGDWQGERAPVFTGTEAG